MTTNFDQADTDNDGAGDVCDTDDDGDSVPDATDNCPFTANPQQSDADADGIGDACDTSDSSLPAAVPVSHIPLPALWLMALLIAVAGGREAFVTRRRSS